MLIDSIWAPLGLFYSALRLTHNDPIARLGWDNGEDERLK